MYYIYHLPNPLTKEKHSLRPFSLKVLMLPHMEVGPTARFDPAN